MSRIVQNRPKPSKARPELSRMVRNRPKLSKLQTKIKNEITEKSYDNNKKYAKTLKQVIWAYSTKTQNLTKHKDYQNKSSKIVMSILLHK